MRINWTGVFLLFVMGTPFYFVMKLMSERPDADVFSWGYWTGLIVTVLSYVLTMERGE
jgi:hypothetical protein